MGAHAFLKFIRARGHVWKKAPKQQPSMKASNRGSQSPPVMAGAALGCPGSPAFEGELCTRERRLLSVLCSALVLSSKRFNRGCRCHRMLWLGNHFCIVLQGCLQGFQDCRRCIVLYP